MFKYIQEGEKILQIDEMLENFFPSWVVAKKNMRVFVKIQVYDLNPAFSD